MSSINPDEFHRDADRQPDQTASLPDKILFWPIVMAIGWPIFYFVPPLAGPILVLILAPKVQLMWEISVVVALYFAARRAYDRKWRRFWSIMALPLTYMIIFISLYATGQWYMLWPNWPPGTAFNHW